MAGGTSIFLIDTAADVNAIKSDVLAAFVTIDSSHILEITGISTSPVKTLGIVEMKIFDKHHKFHVLSPTTPILQDAILGAPFFKEEKARICYSLEVLILASRPTDPIPFCNRSPQALDAESKRSSGTRKGYAQCETSGPFKSNVGHSCYTRISNRQRLLGTNTYASRSIYRRSSCYQRSWPLLRNGYQQIEPRGGHRNISTTVATF